MFKICKGQVVKVVTDLKSRYYPGEELGEFVSITRGLDIVKFARMMGPASLCYSMLPFLFIVILHNFILSIRSCVLRIRNSTPSIRSSTPRIRKAALPMGLGKLPLELGTMPLGLGRRA